MTAFAQVAGEALERDDAVADRLIAGAAGIRDPISHDRIHIRSQPIVELASGTPVGDETRSSHLTATPTSRTERSVLASKSHVAWYVVVSRR